MAHKQRCSKQQNKQEAFKWFKLAAEQGHAQAQYNTAYAYDYGEGITKDKQEAHKWYNKAAQQGHTKAQYVLELIDKIDNENMTEDTLGQMKSQLKTAFGKLKNFLN